MPSLVPRSSPVGLAGLGLAAGPPGTLAPPDPWGWPPDMGREAEEAGGRGEGVGRDGLLWNGPEGKKQVPIQFI